MALLCPETRKPVFDAQLALFKALSESILEVRRQTLDQEASLAQNTKVLLCQTVLPQLLGLARSMGRFGAEDGNFLLSRLYPPTAKNGGYLGPSNQRVKPRNFSNFRY